MKNLIFFGLLWMGISSLIITPQGICACTQLANEYDCSNMTGCVWQQSQCQVDACTNIQVQSDCLKASRYCQWNINNSKCTTFTGCQNINITSYKDCGLSNIQCLSFNGQECQESDTTTYQCSQYQEEYCTENVGMDGVCIWDQSCIAITQCNQAQSNQCNLLNNANKYACQLVNGQCTQITSCNELNEQSCKYYFESLQSTNMILCEWNTNQCIEALNTNYLNSTNCLIATGYNYRWLSTQNSGICVTCTIIIAKSQCECQQYVLQSDCNTSYCEWNNSTCIPLNCSSITSQSICISLQNCFWDYSNTGSCSQFSECNNLPLSGSSLICASQNAYCPAYTGQYCQNASQLNKCTSNDQGCMNWIGSDGICKWTNGLCQPIVSCYQITDAVYCQNHYCEWNASSQLCQPQTCSTYNQNPQKCLYIVQGNEYQFCKYNTQTQLCENAVIGNVQNCSIGKQYRWSNSSSDQGFCLSCKGIQQQNNSSCFCYQFTSQKDCNNSGYCQYNGQCIQKQCSIIYDQVTCSSMQVCQWNGQNGCSNFQGCNQLKATNQLECIGQNIQCKGYVDGKCYANISITCSEMVTCNNSIGSDGICYMNNNQCTGLNSCYGAPQTVCEKFQTACYWNKSQCEPQQCINFTSQQSCIFFLMSPISAQIIPCVWNSQKNICQIAQDIQTQLTSQTCQINSNNTYRWISIDSNNGYCIKCQQQIYFQGQCPCNYLLTQHDCRQAYECYWDNNMCQEYNCQQILLQSVCASLEQCAWVNNQCINYNGECSTLLGSNKYQCLQQQLQCNGSNGQTCIKNMNKCKSNKTLSGCVNIRGIDGFCYWNTQHLICLPATECYQLPQNVCIQQSSSCYYSDDSKCQILTCQQQYLITGHCTYIVSLQTQSRIQTCQFIDNICTNITDLYQLNEEQCFSNSVHTSRWTPLKNNKGICEQCLRNLIPINNNLKCQCYQFITEYDCLNSQCSWQNNECQSPDCTQINDQSQCIKTYGCAWNNNECGIFQSCSIVNGSNLSSCLAYSLICRGYNGTTCTQEPNLTCSQFNQQTCNNNIGTDGLCQYNQNVCQPINQCEQIKNSNICSQYSNACYWVEGQCMTVTCESITIKQNCSYVITSFLTGNIQLCQWDQSKCQSIQQLKSRTSSNCALSTGFTYRWMPTDQSIYLGFCSKCIVDFHTIIPGQCTCYQLYSQIECSQNEGCIWNNSICRNVDCSTIDSQYYCSTNLNCFWNIQKQLCQQFTSCSNLYGSTALECLSQSFNCQYTSGPYEIKMPQPCSSQHQYNSQKNITQLIVDSNLCFFTGFQAQQCSQINSFQMCQQCQYYCTWQLDSNNNGSCQQTNCYNFNEINCKYYFTELGLPIQPTIVYCQWQNNQCVPLSLQTQISNQNQSTCYSNSLYMYRWSSQNQNGTCVSCSRLSQSYIPNYQYLQSNRYTCKCSELPQLECNSVTPICTYTNNKCIETTDCGLYDQSQCSQIQACIWLEGNCQKFTSCSQITSATSPLECVAATINCQVFNGVSCTQSQQCKTFNTSSTCLAQNYQIAFVSGICGWNQGQCVPITYCFEILDRQLCNLQTNRCFWGQGFCKNTYCSLFQTNSTCNFVYSYYWSNFQQPCIWSTNQNVSKNISYGSCQYGPSPQQDESCFLISEYQEYFNGENCVYCSSSLIILIQLYYILTIV